MTASRNGILLFVCNQIASSLSWFLVTSSFSSSGDGGSLTLPLGGLGKEPSPNSAELSLSVLSDQVECLSATLKTTLALRLATPPFEHNPAGIQTPPTWHWTVPLEWNKALKLHDKSRIWQEKINGSPSLWLLPIGFSIAMTSDREGQNSRHHSYIILRKRYLLS